jgi:hemerythrin superfamily protein
MNEKPKSLIEILKEEHQSLLTEMRYLQRAVAGKASGSEARGKVTGSIERLYRLLKSHGDLEKEQLFPALRNAYAEDSNWQLGMTEMQDGLILQEVKRLLDRNSVQSPAVPSDEIKETVSNLSRWIEEHVTMEEEQLFPKLP